MLPKELVLHIQGEIDVRLLSTQRKQMIDILKVLFIECSKKKDVNLPIYGVNQSSL